MQAGCQRFPAVSPGDFGEAGRGSGFKLGNRDGKVHAIEALKWLLNVLGNYA
jgi:hypothetical protein